MLGLAKEKVKLKRQPCEPANITSIKEAWYMLRCKTVSLILNPQLILWCAVTRRPCAGEPAFPSGDNLGANENGSAHAEAQQGSSQPQAPANGAANGVEHTTAADIAASYPVGKGVSDTVVLTALHNEIPLDQFTVPRLWYELKVRAFFAI